MEELKLFTSESVSEGHPDKVADQISDSILDEALRQDKNSRVACEVFVTTEMVIIGGEIRTKAKIDYEKIARDTIRNIGYTSKELGIGADSAVVQVLVHEQSNDIAIGVDENNEKSIGAGDQGIMFGFACKETKGFMPLPIVIAHKLVRIASLKRKEGSFMNARPDMKSQVTIDYSAKKPKIQTVLMSVQHNENTDMEKFKSYLEDEVIKPVLESFDVDMSDYQVLINPTGRFVIGGPDGDAGLTGRKIIVDTYGGYSRHGGGAFSGKDATKVDRSGAYAARWVAKNIVASNLCDMCEIQLSYAIGVEDPVSILVETFGTAKIDEKLILKAIRENFDLTPNGIITALNLQRPIYKEMAAYGHMGRSNAPWEELNKVEELKKYLNN